MITKEDLIFRLAYRKFKKELKKQSPHVENLSKKEALTIRRASEKLNKKFKKTRSSDEVYKWMKKDKEGKKALLGFHEEANKHFGEEDYTIFDWSKFIGKSKMHEKIMYLHRQKLNTDFRFNKDINELNNAWIYDIRMFGENIDDIFEEIDKELKGEKL